MYTFAAGAKGGMEEGCSACSSPAKKKNSGCPTPTHTHLHTGTRQCKASAGGSSVSRHHAQYAGAHEWDSHAKITLPTPADPAFMHPRKQAGSAAH